MSPVKLPPASVTVIVCAPAVRKVKLEEVPVPAASESWPTVTPLTSATIAAASLLAIATLVVAVETMFQSGSTAFTMTLFKSAAPAV